MREYKIVVMGSGGVGKSAITVQFVQNIFVDKYDPTIEDSYRKHLDIDGERCALEILDTAGTEQFTAMRDLYMKNGQGFILVYSITAQSSFNELSDLYEQIKRAKEQSVPIMMVGNKIDLEEDRAISTAQGAAMADKFGCLFMEASAKTRRNIDEVFIEIVKEINRHFPAPKEKNTSCCILS